MTEASPIGLRPREEPVSPLGPGGPSLPSGPGNPGEPLNLEAISLLLKRIERAFSRAWSEMTGGGAETVMMAPTRVGTLVGRGGRGLT